MTVQSRPVPNLVQGVSQQAAQMRRDTQCESQFDCVNSPKDGAVARNGLEVTAFLSSLDLTDAFTYELFREDTEHYLVVITGGEVSVYNLEDGTECTVTVDASYSDYLDLPVGSVAKDSYAVQTVDDFTFIANKTVKPAMADTLSSTRHPEALVFFKSGAYLSRYSLALIYDDTVYAWHYTTPDNGVSGNARFVDPAFLAATFYRAMTGNVATGGSDVSLGGTYDGGVGGDGDGDHFQSILETPLDGSSNPITATSLGFSVAINGYVLRIWREDDVAFEVDTSDAGAGTLMDAFKDNARSFAELPKSAFDGFLLRVQGTKTDKLDDYWVEYLGDSASDGHWQERTAPGVKTTIDPDTMPVSLVNTGLNAFTLKANTWSTRICGDGVDSAKDPGFIGKNIEALFYDHNRLAILTVATCDWSKANKVFTFFPDTVQTVLDDAPVSITLTASETIALMRRALAVDESLFLWAQKAQFRVHSGQDPFKQDTVQAPPTTAYEFTPKCSFGKIGLSVFFATEPEDYTTIRSLTFQNGRVAGDTDVTAHVSEYIAAGARELSVSDTGQMLLVQSDGAPSYLYVYNYLIQSQEYAQSAWNTWRLPSGTILWSSIYERHVYVALQRTDGVVLAKVPLAFSAKDPGTGNTYRTRLDLRVDEGDCTGVTYDADTQETSFTLPYGLTSEEAESKVRVILRTDNTKYPRGRRYEVVSATTGGVVTVKGDLSSSEFYVGLQIVAERTESEFWLRSDAGATLTDRLTVAAFKLTYAKTGFTRIEVSRTNGTTKQKEVDGQSVGMAGSEIGKAPLMVSGILDIGVDGAAEDTTIRMVNDSPFPSAWQSAEYLYSATIRARPSAGLKAAA